MKILVACDKFKGSLSAEASTRIIAEALKELFHEDVILEIPLADGGEGSLDIFLKYADAYEQETEAHDPLMRLRQASYGFGKDGRQAFIEMAKISGLDLVSGKERNAMKAGSKGTGEVFLDALHKGAEEIIIGIGGSASTDGGAGFAQALGYRFLDRRGIEIDPVGENLLKIYSIRKPDHQAWLDKKIIAACDVRNPLNGPEGTACCFAQQKGATPEEMAILEAGMKRLALVTAELTGYDYSTATGAGAGGGLGFGLMAFAQAEYISGFGWLSGIIGLERIIQECDLIITGEGKIDLQTFSGKTVSGICSLASLHKVPVVAYAGIVQDSEIILHQHELSAVFSLTNDENRIENTMKNAGELLNRRVADSIIPLRRKIINDRQQS